MAINIIAACDNNYLIGLNGKLPWHIPADLKRFKELTTGHAVVMGRKTFGSLKKPLADRENIVLSSTLSVRDFTKTYLEDNRFSVVRSLKIALDWRKDYPGEIFIIGGERIFAEAMPIADRIYLTRVDTSVAVKPEDVAVYFPLNQFREEYWKMVGNELCPSFDPAQPSIAFQIFERRK